jgi:hypothetical protein
MKKTILVVLFATTLFACSTPADKAASSATAVTASSCVRTGPEVDLINKAIASYGKGDWATLASCFNDTANSTHNNDSVSLRIGDRIELYKKQRANIDGDVDFGTPNVEVVTLEGSNGIKWGHSWTKFTSKNKAGKTNSTLTFASFAIKDGKLQWEGIIYDTKGLQN